MDEKTKNQLKLVIVKFNSAKNRRYSMKSNGELYEQYAPVIERHGFKKVLASIADYSGDNLHEFLEKLGDLKTDDTLHKEPTALNEPVVIPEPAAEPVPEPGQGLAMLETVIAKQIGQDILGKVESKCDAFIERTYGALPKFIKVKTPSTEIVIKGIVHDKFEQVLNFVSADIPVFLSGPAGSGKNVICKQVSEALDVEFYFSNAVTQEYKITGFTDANGTFHESQFYKAFTNGGLFFLDEMDASVPEVLIIMNAAIANRYFDFPAPIGKVEAHENFRVISAGNTFGLGASIEYTGRNQLDGASLDRFAVVDIDYSKAIELAVAGNDSDLVDFIRSFRDVCSKNGVQSIVSYRAIERISKMRNIIGLEETLRTCLVKNLRFDDVKVIVDELECNRDYKEAMQAIATV